MHTFVTARPVKLRLATEAEYPAEFPSLTVCSPAFFNRERLEEFGLWDENATLANYLVLSLQTDTFTPALDKAA